MAKKLKFKVGDRVFYNAEDNGEHGFGVVRQVRDRNDDQYDVDFRKPAEDGSLIGPQSWVSEWDLLPASEVKILDVLARKKKGKKQPR